MDDTQRATAQCAAQTAATAEDQDLAGLPINLAVGRIASLDVHAVVDNPLHDNSAMDGYLVRSSCLQNASVENPTDLLVLGRIVAGDTKTVGDRPGCWEIMTGGEFPDADSDWDAVVKVEDAEIMEAPGKEVPRIRFSAPARSGQNWRRAGEQVPRGQRIVRAGERITPEKVMLMAACGIGKCAVASPESDLDRKSPLATDSSAGKRVAIVITGQEVVSLESFDESARGKVIDCVTPFLRTYLGSAGHEAFIIGRTGDDVEALRMALEQALRECTCVLPLCCSDCADYDPDPSIPFDLVITLAGVSVGTADNTPSVLASVGVREIFHGVAIKPGRPVMLGWHDATATPVLSLPGNPLAAVVNMRTLGDRLLSEPCGGTHDNASGWTVLPDSIACARSQHLERIQRGTGVFAAKIDANGSPRRLGPGLGVCSMRDLVEADAWVQVEGEAGRIVARFISFSN